VGDNVSKTRQRSVPDPTPAPKPSTGFADPSELVAAAIDGNRDAWDCLVTRYTPLALQITRRYRLNASDANDVCQVVWLQVLRYLDTLREPRALPGWIATTARNESVRLVTSNHRTLPVDPLTGSHLEPAGGGPEIDDGLLAAERRDALRSGLAELTPQQREFLLLVCADPPISYEEISSRLGIPVGSIGPTRARCLAKLRATPSVAALMHP
jgi:RNA polymerase sigma factor (sigma-70 family)